MTPEEWKKELKNELDALREPIERLNALLTLYPYKLSRNKTIKEAFTELENEEKEERYYGIKTDSLVMLYHILTHLPKPSSYLEWMKKRYEISEIQQFALKDFIEFCSEWGNYYDIHEMEESEKDEILWNIATNCEHWQELLGMEQNEWGIEHLTLFPAHPPEHVNEKLRVEGLWYSCKPVYILLNNHPWNKKAKELLDQVYEHEGHYNRTLEGNQRLHIVSLMDFGLQSRTF